MAFILIKDSSDCMVTINTDLIAKVKWPVEDEGPQPSKAIMFLAIPASDNREPNNPFANAHLVTVTAQESIKKLWNTLNDKIEPDTVTYPGKVTENESELFSPGWFPKEQGY